MAVLEYYRGGRLEARRRLTLDSALHYHQPARRVSHDCSHRAWACSEGDSFDEAFESRFSLTLHFPDLDREAREQLWEKVISPVLRSLYPTVHPPVPIGSGCNTTPASLRSRTVERARGEWACYQAGCSDGPGTRTVCRPPFINGRSPASLELDGVIGSTTTCRYTPLTSRRRLSASMHCCSQRICTPTPEDPPSQVPGSLPK